MRKLLCVYMVLLLLIVLAGSLGSRLISLHYQNGNGRNTVEASLPEETEEHMTENLQAETQTETQSETQAETRERIPEETAPERETEVQGEIFLTVSEIRLPFVGQSEDIYAGSVPREMVTWLSADPGIIQVNQGVLTAAGVGTTEITAAWKNQKLSCKVSCLAENQEQFMTLGYDVLQQPKRIPPATDDSCTGYFVNSAMVGDSITYALLHWEHVYGALGNPQFIARGGVSVFGLLGRERLYYFRGGDCLLEDVVSASGLESVFVLLGQNDLGFQKPKEVIHNMQTLMDRVRRKNPEVEIYLQSCLPVREKSIHYSGDNGTLRAFNELLKPFAESRNYHYLNVARYMENQLGSLPDQYAMDEIHPNEEGCKAWMAALRACLYMENLEAGSGSLSPG